MKQIFVSYSREDIEQIHAVEADLKAAGYSVWWDIHIHAGENFRHAIETQLNRADAVLVVWTQNSVVSRWVISEAEHALRQNKLIQVRDNTVTHEHFPKPFGTLHSIGILDSEGIVLAIIKTSSVKALNEEHHFKMAEDKGTVEAYSRFIREHPKSRRVPLAKLRMRNIKRRAEISAFEKEVAEAAVSWTPEQLTEEGDDYYFGFGGKKKDHARAVVYYRLAVKIAEGNQSGGTAMAKLGSLYLHGSPGVPKDQEEALLLLKNAVELGNESAMYTLGLLFENWSNDVQALHWYRRSADSGSPFGMMKVGEMYIQGRGKLRENFNEGIKWLLRAARKSSLGMVKLGDAYRDYHDIGELEGITNAVRWYLRAVFEADLEGAKRLAELYVKGIWDLHIPKPDISDVVNFASVTWRSIFNEDAMEDAMEEFRAFGPSTQLRKLIDAFHKAVDHDNLWAMRALAMVYDRGHEVRRDAHRAAYYLMLAIDRGDETVMSDIDNNRHLFSDRCVAELQRQLKARVKAQSSAIP